MKIITTDIYKIKGLGEILKPTIFFQKCLYGGQDFEKTKNREKPQINKIPNLIQKFISVKILLNKHG